MSFIFYFFSGVSKFTLKKKVGTHSEKGIRTLPLRLMRTPHNRPHITAPHWTVFPAGHVRAKGRQEGARMTLEPSGAGVSTQVAPQLREASSPGENHRAKPTTLPRRARPGHRLGGGAVT